MQPDPGPPREPDLNRLAALVRAGVPQALGDWYLAEHPRVWRLALAFLADAHEADDLAQDAMLHLADRLAQWDPTRPYAPWRSRVVLNLARDRIRRRRVHPDAPLAELPARLPAPDHAAQQQEIRALVTAALAHLPAREREAFVLHDLEGLDAAETAAAMEIGPSSVRSLLTLARRRLRDLLAPRLAPNSAGGAA